MIHDVEDVKAVRMHLRHAPHERHTAIDFAFFKLALLSAGILLGSYFAPFFQGYILFVWILFAVSYTALLYATFGK